MPILHLFKKSYLLGYDFANNLIKVFVKLKIGLIKIMSIPIEISEPIIQPLFELV